MSGDDSYTMHGDAKENTQNESGSQNQEWKTRMPYKMQPKTDFHAIYDASCHCGRVKYELSRKKPLDAKFCHCKTCQKLHGKFEF